jgi:hypothetical protein
MGLTPSAPVSWSTRQAGGRTANFVAGSTWVGNGKENEKEYLPADLPS